MNLPNSLSLCRERRVGLLKIGNLPVLRRSHASPPRAVTHRSSAISEGSHRSPHLQHLRWSVARIDPPIGQRNASPVVSHRGASDLFGQTSLEGTEDDPGLCDDSYRND